MGSLVRFQLSPPKKTKRIHFIVSALFVFVAAWNKKVQNGYKISKGSIIAESVIIRFLQGQNFLRRVNRYFTALVKRKGSHTVICSEREDDNSQFQRILHFLNKGFCD